MNNLCNILAHFLKITIIGFISVNLISCKVDNKFNIGQNNAIWAEAIFLRGIDPKHTKSLKEQDIVAFAENLKKYNIKYAFLFAGPFNKEGHLPEYPFSPTASKTIKFLKDNYPEIVILPWVGGIQNKTVFLEDTTWVRIALKDCKKLIETHSVTGLHFDFEFILKGDQYLERTEVNGGSVGIESYGENVIDFHKKFREMMPNAFISSVVVAPSPGTRPWKRKTPSNELEVLSNYIDQLSFLYFDTYLNKQYEFEKNCYSLLKVIQKLKESNRSHNVQFLIAIGTFTNALELQKYRDMNIENIPNTIETILKCSQSISPSNQIVDGISIYCNWETDDIEWNQIYKNWTHFK